MRRYLLLIFVLLAAGLVLAACAEEGSASEAIEKYLKVKIEADADEMTKLACRDYEVFVQLEAESFESVDAELQDMACSENGKDGEYTLVTCEGTLVIEYRGEDPREQSLSGTTYLAVKEDDEWKMCGEQ
jgi:hypothetical protein